MIQKNRSIVGGGAERRRRRALLVALRKFAIACCFVGIFGLGIDALQSAAAQRGLCEASRAGVQSRQTLVNSKIVGGQRQCSHQRSERLGGHIVRDE